jgi:hypothetical protein
MQAAVDYYLGGVDLPVAANLGVGALARRVGRAGERILPAEIIPIVDGHAHRHDAGILDQFAEQLVGRRARRAALAGEQLHHCAGFRHGSRRRSQAGRGSQRQQRKTNSHRISKA